MKGRSSPEMQVLKIFRHTRMGSFGTRARYKSSCLKFAKFVSDKFKLQNIRNLHDKHIIAFIKEQQQDNLSGKTIKNDLAAIRFLHDQVAKPRHELSNNKALQEKYNITLEKTPAVKGNRAWTEEEYQNLKSYAISQDRTDEADVMTLCRTIGLRITEAVAIKRSQAQKALRTGIHFVGSEAKNGKKREVQLSKEAREVFKRRLEITNNKTHLFIKKHEKTHEVVNRLEKWLQNNRNRFESAEGRKIRTWEKYGKTHINELTYHGLRYNYIQERVREEQEKGFTLEQACKKITKTVGHERIEVMRTYLGK